MVGNDPVNTTYDIYNVNSNPAKYSEWALLALGADHV